MPSRMIPVDELPLHERPDRDALEHVADGLEQFARLIANADNPYWLDLDDADACGSVAAWLRKVAQIPS